MHVQCSVEQSEDLTKVDIFVVNASYDSWVILQSLELRYASPNLFLCLCEGKIDTSSVA